MTKIRNFGSVIYQSKKKQINYTYFDKDENGEWQKYHSQKMIQNDVYVPNNEAVAMLRQGKMPELNKDLFGKVPTFLNYLIQKCGC